MKRKPDPLLMVAALLAVGLLASTVFFQQEEEPDPQVATGFATQASNGSTASR